jgi:hypothetical protein
MVNPPSRQETKEKIRRRSAKAQSAPPAAVPSSTKRSVSSCDDLKILIANRAYELYSERGYRHGFALDDWIEAEREILSQIPP